MPVASNLARTRARIASAARDVGQGRQPQSTLDDARRDHCAESIANFIERHVEKSPPLTDSQITRLTELLKPVRIRGGA